ncbi:MAG: DUF2892 domain-containing protein [Bacteroidetes bacterium]|nr:DUF2892 domain-containing protein [Bacteroidota bacterium]
MMRKNVGTIDRIIRILFALGILILFLAHQITGGTAVFLGFAAIILFFTGTTSFCPCYVRLNIKTVKEEEKK